MRQVFKNIFVTFLLGVLAMQVLVPLAVCISVHFTRNAQWKFINENFSNKAVFSQVVLNENEYENQVSSRTDEIKINGMLYDIHSVKRENGKVMLTVLSDETEADLQKIATSVSDHTKENNLSSAMFFSFLYYEGSPVLLHDLAKQENCYPELAEKNFPLNYLKVATPPPDLHS